MKTIEIRSGRQLVEALNDYSNEYVFRGHADAEWRLQPTLERIIPRDKFSEMAGNLEDYSKKIFQSKFHVYKRDEPEPHTYLSWLALMRHSGVPTRLLDFSESPYVALYFAMADFNTTQELDTAVVAINYFDILNRTIDRAKTADASFSHDALSFSQLHDAALDEMASRKVQPSLLVTEPDRANPRMDRQAGTFLFSSSPSTRIEDLLAGEYSDCDMHKLVIRSDLYQNAYALLRHANVNGKALYGDLSGLAEFIRMELKTYSA